MEAAQIPDEIETRLEVADPIVQVLDDVSGAMPAPAKRVLGGDWLGHPLHPVLTDLPIGFWTSSMLLDFFGRRVARTSTAMAGLGVATAVPTVAAGLAEWSKLSPSKKRVGALHVIANGSATALYALSVLARLRGKRGTGVTLGMVAGAVATAGGFLGGHLAFGPDETVETEETV